MNAGEGRGTRLRHKHVYLGASNFDQSNRMSSIETLLTRSQAFVEHLFSLLGQVEEWDSRPRAAACASSCELSSEHGQAVYVLFASGLPNAACVAMRAQYEAVLRAAWLQHCASPDEVNRLLQPLTLESEQGAKNLPGPQKMLGALQSRLADEPGLKGLVQPLTEAHTVLWKALNSFAHAGIHALHRTEYGFPEPLVKDAIKNSNVLAHFSARLMVRTAEPVELHHVVDRAWQGFEDCLPTIQPMS